MTIFTLATLRTRCRSVGDYENSRKITDAFLNEQINDAIGEYSDLLDERWEGYRDTTGSIVTTAGVATVALPANFLKARAVDLLSSGRYCALRKLQIRSSYGYDSQRGRPHGYMQVGVNLELFPTPDAVYTIRLRYVPTAPVLVADVDSIDVPNGWEGFVVHTALLKIDEKEERPLQDRLAVIDRYRARIVAAASDRNVAEPEYIPFPGEEGGGVW
jgi:hypothetical protein